MAELLNNRITEYLMAIGFWLLAEQRMNYSIDDQFNFNLDFNFNFFWLSN